jgi:hypothetical protein
MPKWTPPPGYSLDDADAMARRLLGPLATAHYEPKAPKAQRFMVSVKFRHPDNGRWTYGVIGWGDDWSSALAEAEKRWTAYVAEHPEAAETLGLVKGTEAL